MKAVLRRWGTGMVFRNDYTIPTCGLQDVLVHVKAGAINPVDYKIVWPLGGSVVGFDFAGVIEKVGEKVTHFNVGDEVYGKVNGSLAEFAVAKPDEIALKPKSISFAEAAAMPITYITSLQGLRDYGNLKKGGRVLVIGASGGCGISALQLAKALGAGHIVGVCSGKNAAFVKLHGANEVIDYTEHDIVNYFHSKSDTFGPIDDVFKFDVIYDAASNSGGGEDYKNNCLQLLHPGAEPDKKQGQYVATNGGAGMWLRTFTIGHKKNQHLFLGKVTTADLENLAGLVDVGWKDENGEHQKLSPVISQILPFNADNVDKGFSLLKSRRTVGKIVFDVTV